jgi:hypothetical protein
MWQSWRNTKRSPLTLNAVAPFSSNSICREPCSFWSRRTSIKLAMLSCETDCRRVSQQSIPSLSSISTDSSTSLDTQRRVNYRSKATRNHTAPAGYVSQSNGHSGWKMDAYQPMLSFAPQAFHSYPSVALPLGYYNDPGGYSAAACEETWNKSRHYYGNQGIKVYEPIMPVPLAVTMEATMFDCEPSEFDYDDNIPLAYFQRLGQVSNPKLSNKGKTRAHSIATNITSIDCAATPVSTTKMKSPSSTSLGLRKNHKPVTNINNPTSPGHKRKSEQLSKRESTVVESRRAATTTLHHKRNMTPKETLHHSHEAVPCGPSPNSIKRFLANINRFNIRHVKSGQ